MTRAQAYILTGHFEGRDSIRLDEPVDEAPGSAVRVTVVVESVSPSARGQNNFDADKQQGRLNAFERLVSRPVSNEDRAFWKQLVEEQHDARKLGTSEPEDI